MRKTDSRKNMIKKTVTDLTLNTTIVLNCIISRDMNPAVFYLKRRSTISSTHSKPIPNLRDNPILHEDI